MSMISSNRKIINNIVKENIEYLNINKEELVKKLSLSVDCVSKIINGNKNLELSILLKLEKALDLPPSSLVNLNNELEKYAVRKNDKGMCAVAAFLEKQTEFKLYDKGSLINIASKFIGSDKLKDREKEFLLKSKGFRKFKDKPLAYLWISLLQKKCIDFQSQGQFNESDGASVLKSVLDIMITEQQFDTRVKKLKKYLDKNGIVLVNAPFIPDSTINGATYIENNQRFIFMSDMKKREYQYIFSLIHELFHYYQTDFKENEDNKVADYITAYLRKYNKQHNGLQLAMQTYKDKLDNKWDILYEKTKNEKIDFGNINKLWSSGSLENFV